MIPATNLLMQYWQQNYSTPLPFGYKRVSYLTSNMGAGISIQQTLDWSKTVTIRIKAKLPQLNKRICFLGNYQSSTHGETLNLEVNDSNKWRIWHATGTEVIVDYVLSIDTVYVFESVFTPSTGSVHRIYAEDGALLAEASGFSLSNTTTRFILFRDGRGTTFYPVDIYHLEILHAGEKTGDFIPVLRQADYKPGMFDLCRNGVSSTTNTSFWVKGPPGDEFTWDGLVFYHPLAQLNASPVLISDGTWQLGDYNFISSKYNGIYCSENTNTLTEGNYYLGRYVANSYHPTLTASVLFWLNRVPTGTYPIQPVNLLTALTSGVSGTLYSALNNKDLRLWNNNTSAMSWKTTGYTKTWTTGNWNMMTIILAPEHAKLYIDNELMGSKSYTFGTPSGEQWMRMGFRLPLNTAFADFAVYNRELSATEVADRYNSLINV